MAGLGGSWGSREEFLHPRDKHGRFRKKWKMAAGVIDAISNFLDRFSPRTFQSDGQAAQYLFNRAKPGRFGGGTQYSRLHADYDEANQHLRSGDIDAPTQKFIKMMDDSSVNLDSEVILSRTMGPEAFGLSPQQMDLEDGGIEDFTGRLIADRGYSAANIGTPMAHGPGKVTMSIAVPKGTKVIIPARSQNDRGIFLDRDQELRITKVQPDGRGGWYMMAVATPRTPGETPEPLDRGPRGIGLTPQEREARILQSQGRQAKREGIRTDAEINAEEIQRGTQQAKQEQPAELPPAQGAPQQPAAPGEPPPRNEPVLKESVGGADTQGKGTAEIAETPPPEVPTPEAPAAPVRNFREAVREAGVPSPSAGPRRQQWNKAYLGVASGKKDPGDMLRELDRDIDYFKRVREDRRSSGTEDPELDGDIDAMEKLADVISREYGIERSKPAAAPAPAPTPTPKASGAATPIGTAAGERRRELPGEPGAREVTNIKEFKTQKNQQIQEREERKRRLLSPPPEASPPAPEKKAPVKKATVTSLAEARAQKLTPEQRRQVSDLSDQERRSYQGFRGKGMTHEDALQSAQDAVASRNARQAEKAIKALGQAKSSGPMTLAEAKRRTAVDAVNENKIEGEGDNSYKNILRNVESGEWTTARARKEAKDSAKYWRQQAGEAKNLGRATPEERERIQNKNNAIADKYEKLEDELLKSESVTKTDKYRNRAPSASATKEPSPAPSKETAEKFPETTPGSGKVRMSQLEPGVPILVEKSGDNWVPATKKTGATKITVEEVNRVTGRGGQHQVIGVDEDGNRVQVQSRANVQTFFLGTTRPKKTASSPTPAKKVAAPKAAPASTPDILAQLNAEDANNIPVLTREQANELLAPLRKAQLVEMARELNVPGPSNKTVPELKLWIVESTLGARRDSIATRGFTGKRPGEGGLPGRGSLVPAAEPGSPVAQKPIQAPDRRTDFAEAWLNTPALANIDDKTAAGRTINEVRDDIAAGRITPDEGIRRLENDISFNQEDLAEVKRELRGDPSLEERLRLSEDARKLRAAISEQESASSFIRGHFRKAPVATPDEIKVEVEPEVREVIEKLTPSQIRQMAKVSGYGELKGDKKEDLLQDLIKKIAGRELESRAAKKTAKKLAPAPLVTKKSSDPDYVDARALAEGLDMDTSDQKMLDSIQEMLDGGGRFNERPKTPAAVGRELEIMARGAGGPYWERVVHHQVTLEKIQDQIAGKIPSPFTPDQLQERLKNAQAKDLALKQSGDRWLALAERLKKTRRRPTRKATEPAPEKPKLSTAEKATTREAAKLLDVEPEKLQKQVLAKRAAAAPAPESVQSAVETLRKLPSRDEGKAFLARRTKPELQQIAKASGMPYTSKDTKQTLIDRLVQREIGGRLEGEALRSVGTSSHREPTGPAVANRAEKIRAEDILPPVKEVHEQGGDQPLEDMSPSELATFETMLGIKRTSLDRAERIAAIKAARAGQVSEKKPGPKQQGEPIKHRRAPYESQRGGRVAVRNRPLSDEPIHLPNGGADQGLVHFDSELGELWQDLYMDDREPNSFVNEIARIGEGVGIPENRDGHLSLEEALNRLRAMKTRATDKAVEDRIQSVINNLDAPKVSVPDLPDTVPSSVVQALKDLAKIPTARRTGRIGTSRVDESILNKKIDIVRQIDAGKFRLGEGDSKLRNRDLHEGADGALAMWRIFERLFNMPDRLPDGSRNPEWVELRDWLRGRHLRGE